MIFKHYSIIHLFNHPSFLKLLFLLITILGLTFQKVSSQDIPKNSLESLISDYHKLDESDSLSGVLLRKIIAESEKEKEYDTLAKYGVRFFKNRAPGLGDQNEELEILQKITTYDSLIKSNGLKGTVHLKYAGALFNFQRYPEAIREYTIASETFPPSDSLLIADSFLFRAQAEESIGNLIASMNDYQKARNIYQSLGNEQYEHFALSGIAILFSKFSIYDEAEKIRNELRDYYQKTGSPIDKAIQTYNQAKDYEKLGLDSKKKEALLSINSQLPFEEPYPYLETLLKLKLAIIFAEEGNLKEQKHFFTQAEELILEYQPIEADNLIYLYAKYWNKLNSGDDFGALDLAKQMLAKAKETNEMDHYFYAYQVLGNSYERVGDFKNALKYQKDLKAFQDSLFIANRATTFSYYQTLYETEKKESEISKKTAQIEEINRFNRTRIRIFVSVIIAMLVIGVLLFLWKNLQATRKKAELQSKFSQELLKNQEEERLRISKDLHDGLGQSLLLIKNKVRLNQDLPTGELLDTAINELRAIARSLHPMQLEKLGLAKAIKYLLDQVDRETAIFVSSEIEDLGGTLEKSKELQIYRIFQESLNNILKHAEASAIQVSLVKLKNKVVMTISDNGKGFDFSEKYNDFQSLGLKTLKERTGAIQGTMKVSSENGKGTILSFSVNV